MTNRVRAIIIDDDKLLIIKRVKKDSVYFVFPGGGVEESDKDKKTALIRECKEELGVDVEVLELIIKNSFFRKDEGEQREYFYKCNIIGGKLGTGDGPEFQENSDYEGTHELEWIKISELGNFDIRPVEVKTELFNLYAK